MTSIRPDIRSEVGPAGMWEIKRDFQRDFCLSNGLQPSQTFLDIGCGVLRGGIPLIQYLDSGGYTGVDVRPSVIGTAKELILSEGLADKKPNLIAWEDIGTLPVNGPFDFIWAFSVLFHMSDDILIRCLSTVKRIMAEDGLFFANIDTRNAPDGRWKTFPKVHRSLDKMANMAERAGLSMSPMGTLDVLGHVTGKPSHDKQVMLRIQHQD